MLGLTKRILWTHGPRGRRATSKLQEEACGPLPVPRPCASDAGIRATCPLASTQPRALSGRAQA